MVTTRNKTNTDTAADARQANASTKKNAPAKCKTEEDEEYFPGPGPDSDGEDSLNHDDNLDDEERSLCSTNDSITHGDDVSCLSDSDTDDLTNNVDGINDNDDADDSSLNALLGPENKKMLPLPSKVVTVLKRGAKSLKSLKDKVKSALVVGVVKTMMIVKVRCLQTTRATIVMTPLMTSWLHSKVWRRRR